MANDLTIQTAAQRAISSTALSKLRRISLGTIQWPGEPMRRYLAGGLKLTPIERDEAEATLKALQSATAEGEAGQAAKGRFGIVANMLLAYPIAGASSETGRARGEAYREALAGLPPWAVAEAVKRWHRGECGEHDYRWAPAPAVLRRAALEQLAPYQDAALDLRNLLEAKPLDELMHGTVDPEARARIADGFRKLGDELRRTSSAHGAPLPDVGTNAEPQAEPAAPAEEAA